LEANDQLLGVERVFVGEHELSLNFLYRDLGRMVHKYNCPESGAGF
jgi:hypothetical protein